MRAVNNTATNRCSRLDAKKIRGKKEYVKQKGRLYGWCCRPMDGADDVGKIWSKSVEDRDIRMDQETNMKENFTFM
jgi:hypothetical protein